MRLFRDEQGQTIIMVALALPCLIAFIGLAVDVGVLFRDRRQVQTAADAAAVAAALNENFSYFATSGKAASAANGFPDGLSGTTVTVLKGPAWPSSRYLGNPAYVEATISKRDSTIFLALFGRPTITISARAVATNQAPGNGCVYLLADSGTGLSVQGNITVNAPDCAINIDSSTSPIAQVGKSALVTTSSIGTVGPAGTLYGFSPYPVSGIVPFSDPLASMQFPYTCSSAGCTCPSSSALCAANPVPTMPSACITASLGSNTRLSPGCYNGLSVGNNAVTLDPGIYFLNGSVTVGGNGTLAGTGVTLIFTSGAFSLTGTPTMRLAAPTAPSAAFPGILYYQVPADLTAISLGGNASSTIEGVFYAPTAGITLQGTPGGNIYTNFVANTLTLAGNASFNSYSALPGAASTMHAIALVE